MGPEPIFYPYDCQEGDGEGANPEVKDLQFTYIPSGAEIISIDAFSRSTHKHDFVIGTQDFDNAFDMIVRGVQIILDILGFNKVLRVVFPFLMHKF